MGVDLPKIAIYYPNLLASHTQTIYFGILTIHQYGIDSCNNRINASNYLNQSILKSL